MGSVEAYQTQSGKRYRVQYRTPDRRNTMKRGRAGRPGRDHDRLPRPHNPAAWSTDEASIPPCIVIEARKARDRVT